MCVKEFQYIVISIFGLIGQGMRLIILMRKGLNFIDIFMKNKLFILRNSQLVWGRTQNNTSTDKNIIYSSHLELLNQFSYYYAKNAALAEMPFKSIAVRARKRT